MLLRLRLRRRLRRLRLLPPPELLLPLLELPLADLLAGAIWVNFAISCHLLRFGWFTLRPLLTRVAPYKH